MRQKLTDLPIHCSPRGEPAGEEHFQASLLNNMTINPSPGGRSTPLRFRDALLNREAATAPFLPSGGHGSPVDERFTDNRSQAKRGFWRGLDPSREARSIIKNMNLKCAPREWGPKPPRHCRLKATSGSRVRGEAGVQNGVILQTRLTSAGTRVYFYRTYLFRQEAKKWGHRIAAYAQESFSKVGRSSRTAGSRLELRDGNREIVFIF